MARNGVRINNKWKRTTWVQGAAAADCCISGSESRKEIHIANDDEEEGGEEGERAGRTNPAMGPDYIVQSRTSQSMALLATCNLRMHKPGQGSR
jgi:hypothetical protein